VAAIDEEGLGMRTPTQKSRVLCGFALVALGVLGTSGSGLGAGPTYHYNYGGTTSQNHPFHLSLSGNSSGYSLFASWYDTYSPSPCNDDIGEPRTYLNLATVHLHSTTLGLAGVTAVPRSVLPHKVTLNAVFTKGKVSGSFVDTTGSKGRTGPTLACTTGTVTFTASRL
jgi:hypothetical protein